MVRYHYFALVKYDIRPIWLHDGVKTKTGPAILYFVNFVIYASFPVLTLIKNIPLSSVAQLMR